MIERGRGATAGRGVEAAVDVETPHASIQVQRFWLLDNLRGVAALSVAIFHYQHFYYGTPEGVSETIRRVGLPLQSVLKPIYDYGHSAVQLFFVVSGFIFFHVYYASVRDKSVSGREFWMARFSRLYPLHFATLLFVAAGQFLSMRIAGHATVYPHNDLYHFGLNIFLASHWGLEFGESFNGPVWSLSVEVLLYCCFYLYARHLAPHITFHLLSAGAAFVVVLLARRMVTGSAADVFHGLMCFLAGGSSFLMWEKIATRSEAEIRWFLASFLLAGAIAFGLCVKFKIMALLFFVSFPALVLLLAIIQIISGTMGRPYRLLGDISYAVYLVHFPLQLFVIVLASYAGIGIKYSSPLSLAAYLAALGFVSAVIYLRFERPMQSYLRSLPLPVSR